MTEYLIRFLIGGLAVSSFSILGDLLRPKSFAGIFGAAPSIALTTLAMAVGAQGTAYAAVEARSMILGAGALFVYTSGVCWLMEKRRFPALAATALMVPGWLTCAFGLQLLVLGAGT